MSFRGPKWEGHMECTEVGKRFATPEVVADYRAERLACDTLIEIGCGIGSQTLSFAKTCKKVIACDIDPQMVRCTKKNLRLHNITNVEVVQADGTAPHFVETIRKEVREGVDHVYVFCDPSRSPTEDSRTLLSMHPHPEEILENFHWADGIAIEAPPQIAPDSIRLDCEKEYLSVEGHLNRLTLYFMKLKRCERSCVAISKGIYYFPSVDDASRPKALDYLRDRDMLKKFVYEPDPAIIKAHLLEELGGAMSADGDDVSLFRLDKKRVFFTSSTLKHSPFFKHSYIVDDVMDMEGGMETVLKIANAHLKNMNASRAILRGNINPEEYWDVRNVLEKDLNKNGVNYHVLLGSNALVFLRSVN